MLNKLQTYTHVVKLISAQKVIHFNMRREYACVGEKGDMCVQRIFAILHICDIERVNARQPLFPIFLLLFRPKGDTIGTRERRQALVHCLTRNNFSCSARIQNEMT